jgi:hypothetical protein
MGKIVLDISLNILLIVAIIAAVFIYCLLCISICYWLFGTWAWGLIPIVLTFCVGCTYPGALHYYEQEIQMQNKIEKSLRKDWTNWKL